MAELSLLLLSDRKNLPVSDLPDCVDFARNGSGLGTQRSDGAIRVQATTSDQRVSFGHQFNHMNG